MTPGEQACSDLKVSIRDYFDARLKSIMETFEERNKILDERLKNVNHFKDQLANDRSIYTTRELHDKLQSEVSKLDIAIEATRSRVVSWFGLMTIFDTIIIALLIYHFNK